MESENEEDEEEYVMLDLSSISDHISIPPNAPYVLSGLDTLNPILVIDNNIKLACQSWGFCVIEVRRVVVFCAGDQKVSDCLFSFKIGEYKETMGTCLVFDESDVDPIGKEKAGPFKSKQTPAKQVNPIARLDKILKFRLFLEADNIDGAEKHADKPS